MLFILYDEAKIARMAIHKHKIAEPWHQRLGHSGPSQLSSGAAYIWHANKTLITISSDALMPSLL